MDERKKHIDDLREFYKNKNEKNNSLFKKFAENEEQDDENNNINDNFFAKVKKINKSLVTYYKYIIATFLFFIIGYVIIMSIDSLIVKDLVHSRATISVPNIIGKKLGQAQLLLNDKNLKYEVIKRQFDLKHEKGTVIRQIPSPGRLIKENRMIYLTVSEGIEEITTPKLLNLSVRQARVELVNSGLVLGNISESNSDNIEAGLIISQNPSKNTKLRYNDKVNIVVSKGSENQLILPDFKTMTIEEAREIIESMGLKVGSIITIEDETFQNGTVIGQFPLPGEVVIKSSYIDLEIVSN